LVSFDGAPVPFHYGTHRAGDAQGQPQPAELRLKTAEFLHRGSAHVPLPGVQMVRAWGLDASPPRPKLQACRAQLPEEAPRERPQVREHESPHDQGHFWERCPGCHPAMVVTQVRPRAGAPPAQLSWLVAA
jgi:Putative transposase